MNIPGLIKRCLANKVCKLAATNLQAGTLQEFLLLRSYTNAKTQVAARLFFHAVNTSTNARISRVHIL